MVAKNNLCVLVLAGGKGTRMKSDIPKPLHKICGAEILAHILKEAVALKPARIGVLTGHQSDLVKETVKNNLQNWYVNIPVDFILQKELTGSGTAAKYSVPFMRKYGQILILAGDAPLIKAQTLKSLIQKHKKTNAACTVFAVETPDPKGYGRIIKDSKNSFVKIVEESETDSTTAAIKEVNSGMYIFDVKALLSALPLLKPQGPKKEYYLTDTLAILKQKGRRVEVFTSADYTQALGINSKKQLAEAAKIMQTQINDALMDEGVTLMDPNTTYISKEAEIGADTIIYPGVFIDGKVIIGRNCIIGPFVHLRPGTIIKENVKIGNFVEIKKSVIGKGSKVPHLSYIGDSEIGEKVNIGAGSITCNYDGAKKHKTIIKNGVFVGSNTNFVAPVVIGEGAKIGAGSTITRDIPAGCLAIARARQINIKKENKK